MNLTSLIEGNETGAISEETGVLLLLLTEEEGQPSWSSSSDWDDQDWSEGY